MSVEQSRTVLAHLMSTRGNALHAYSAALCRNATEGRDLLQDVLVAVLSRGQGVSDVAQLEAFIRSALVRRYIDRRRREQRFRFVRHLVATAPSDRGVEQEQLETRIDVLRALEPLSPMQRAAVLRFYYDDQPVAVIAVELRCSEGNVKRHLSDARQRLSRSLAQYSENEVGT